MSHEDLKMIKYCLERNDTWQRQRERAPARNDKVLDVAFGDLAAESLERRAVIIVRHPVSDQSSGSLYRAGSGDRLCGQLGPVRRSC